METVLSKNGETRESVVIENRGEKIFGLCHMPSCENPPLVIVFHGFASHKVGTNRSHVRLAEALTKSGIGVFRFDFRGSGDREGDLATLGYEDLLSDAMRVVAHFVDLGYTKIGLFGSSLGGSIAIGVAEKFREVKALAVWAAVASGEMWIRDYLKRETGSVSMSQYRGNVISDLFQKQFLRMRAADDLLQLGKIPFLHFQGDKDETLSLEHRRAFEMSRAQAQAESRFLLFPENSHYFGYSNCFDEVVRETLSWFTSYLKN